MLCSNAFGSKASVELSVLPIDAPYLARFSELGLFESPSVDLYRRADDLGVTDGDVRSLGRRRRRQNRRLGFAEVSR